MKLSMDTIEVVYLVGQTFLGGLGLKLAVACGPVSLPLALLFVGLYSWAMLEVVF